MHWKSKLWKNAASNLVSQIKSSVNSNGIIGGSHEHDCSVIIASLYSGTPYIFNPNADTLYQPTDIAVVNTVNDTVAYWQSVYPMNKSDDSYPKCTDNDDGYKMVMHGYYILMLWLIIIIQHVMICILIILCW